MVWLAFFLAASAVVPSSETPPEDPGLVEQVVVTATRVETPLSRVGSSVTILERADLERRSIRRVEDALREVPGLDLRRNGGPGSVSSIFLRGMDGDHTLVLLDGIAMNDPSTPSNAAFTPFLTTDDVERIEVLRGPQGPLYGSSAIGGVVQVVSTVGDGPPTLAAWAEGGSYGTLAGGVRSSGRIGRAGYSASLSRTVSDGYSASPGGTEDDGFDDTALSTKLDLDLGERSDLEVVLHHIDGSVDFDGFAAESGQRIDSRQTALRIAPHWSTVGGRFEHRAAVQAARHGRDTVGEFPSSVDGTRYAATWQGDWTFRPGRILTAGVEAQREAADFEGFEADARTVAAFAQQQVATDTGWFGAIGLRFDDHSLFGGHATWRGAGGRTIGRTTVRASAGTGFKAPSLYETSPESFGGNPGLDPETSWGADFGVEQRFDRDRGVVRATLFASDVDDLIVAVFDAATGSFVNFNVDRATARGVEFEGTYRAARTWIVRAGYTYTASEAEGNPAGFGLADGEPLLRRPRNKGSLGATWSRGCASLSVDARYVGESRDLDPATFEATEAPSYTVADLAGSVDLGAGVQLFARLENLFDEEYQDVLGFAAPERAAYAGVRWNGSAVPDRAPRR